MTIVSRPFAGRFAALIGVLLLAAQSLALAHAYQHDPGSAVETTCASCVIGGQLANACADSASDRVPGLDAVSHEACDQISFDTVIIPAAKQRGPPA